MLGQQLTKIDKEFDVTILLDSSRPCKPSGNIKKFMDKHCMKGHYQFSIKKCTDDKCICGPPRTTPEVFAQFHLPFPVPQHDKYMHFEVNMTKKSLIKFKIFI